MTLVHFSSFLNPLKVLFIQWSLYLMRSSAVHPSLAVRMMFPLRDRVTAATVILSSAPALRSCWLNASRYWIGRQVEGSISDWGWIMRRRSWKVGVLGGGVSFFCLGDCRFLACGALLMLLLPVGGEAQFKGTAPAGASTPLN